MYKLLKALVTLIALTTKKFEELVALAGCTGTSWYTKAVVPFSL